MRKRLLFDDNLTKLNTDVTIDNNPLYDVTKATIKMQTNPSYDVTKATIKMQTNPSYGVNIQEERAVATGSDTKAHQPSHDATTEQYDYTYVQDDHLLHHNTSANTTGDAKETLYY